MNIKKLFENNNYLDSQILFFKNKKHINLIHKNEELVIAHIEKARHNIKFYKLNKQNEGFNDWLVVVLYYSLYHCALALITNKNYKSKNHYATILLLVKEYNLSQKEAEFIKDLSIKEEDAKLYTELRSDRKDASYATFTRFDLKRVNYYEDKVLDFFNKTKEILNDSLTLKE